MGIEASVGLIVASLDLRLVRLVRAAMNGGAGACGAGRGVCPERVIEPRRRIEPEPEIEPRKHVHPTPVFEPRPRHRPDAVRSGCGPLAPVTPTEPSEKSPHPSWPIEPPWKVLPWEGGVCNPPRPVRKIKVFEARPDMRSKGAVIDLFI